MSQVSWRTLLVKEVALALVAAEDEVVVAAADEVVPLLVICVVVVEAWEACRPTAAAARTEVASVVELLLMAVAAAAAAAVAATEVGMVAATATLEEPLDLPPGGKGPAPSTQRFLSFQHTFSTIFLYGVYVSVSRVQSSAPDAHHEHRRIFRHSPAWHER